MAKQLPLQAQLPVSIKDAKGRPLSQTDAPARPSAEHLAHAVGHALSITHRLSRFTRLELNAAPRKATGVKASVDDLLHRSGNSAQGIFEVGVTQASQLAQFLSSQKALVVEIHKGIGHFRIPTTTARSALLSVPTSSSSRMITTSQAGCPSSIFGAG